MIHLLLGRTRSLRDRALQKAGIGGTDPFGRPTLLHLVPSSHLRDHLQERPDSAEAQPRFTPLVQTFSEWCEELWALFGDGRPLLGSAQVALCARWLLDQHGQRWPTLQAVPDLRAVARELVRLEARSRATRTRNDQPEVADLVDLLRATLAASPHPGVLWTELQEGLLERLSAPSPVLVRRLGAYPSVLFDDLTGSTPLEAELIVAAMRAFDAAGASVVLATASGRDRGGAEVGLLLGWEQPTDREHRVFASTKQLRESAFALIETGEASVWLSTPNGVREIDEGSEIGKPAPRTLADAYADGSLLVLRTQGELRERMGAIELLHPDDPVMEARAVALRIRALLEEGVDPRECVVALADMALAEEMAQALADVGIHSRGAGCTLRSHPLGWAVGAIAGLALDDFGADALCDLADYVDWALQPPTKETGAISMGSPPQRVRQWCRAARIRGGRPSTWALGAWAARTKTASPGTWGVALHRLDALAALLLPLAQDRTPSDWHRALHVVFDTLDLASRAQKDESTWSAWASLLEALQQLVHDLSEVHRGAWSAASLREALDELLDRVTFDPVPAWGVAVPLISLEDLQGLVPRHLFLTGLVRGTFPKAPPPAFLGETSPERLHEARFLLASLLREAHAPDGSIQTLVLSWPATRGGTPVPPSLLLIELLELPTSVGALGELCTVRPSETGLDATRRTDRLAAAILSPAWLERLPPNERLSVEIQALACADRQGTVGPRDGVLTVPPPRPSLTVTALETYVRCPARYWYTYVLKLSPPDRSYAELEPRRRGIALHRVLEKFLLGRSMAPLCGETRQQEARQLLFEVANEVLDRVDQEGGFDPLFQRYARARWTAGLVDAAPAGVLRAWLDAEIAGPPSIPEAVEQAHEGLAVGPVTLKGVIDRVDRYPSGVRLVTDYKTGTPPPRSWVESGFTLQPIAYAAMVAAATGQPVAASFLSLGRPDELGRTAFVGHPQALDEVCTPEERRRAVVLDDAGRAALLAKAGKAAQSLLDGRFPPSPHSQSVAGCPTCAFRRICRLDPHRHSDMRAADAAPEAGEP